jgi:hypothetical protein
MATKQSKRRQSTQEAVCWRVSLPQREPDLEVFVPGEPVTVNHMYCSSGIVSRGHGRVHYRSQACVAWENTVDAAIVNAFAKRPFILTTPLTIMLVFNRIRGDVTNYIKATEDGIKTAIGIDDNFFHPVIPDKRAYKTQPRGAYIALWSQEATV